MLPAACPACKTEAVPFIPGTSTPEEWFSPAHPYAITGTAKRRYLPVFRCPSCGHGFTPLTDAQKDLPERWYAAAAPDDAYMAEEAGRRMTAKRLLRTLGTHVHTGRLLDIGCGPGLFVKETVAAGWQAEGMDAAAWAVEAGAARGLAVRRGMIHELAAYPAGSFDALTAFDVLEHLPDPAAFLRTCAHLLKPGGVLMLTTPRFDSIAARLLGKRWHCILPAHLHYFSRASLRMMLEQAGLSVARMRSHTRRFTPAYLFRRLTGTADILRPGPSWLPWIPVNLGDEHEVCAVRTGT